MYIPPVNRFEDLPEIVNFMQRFSFATIVTVKNGLPVATHLPFLVKQSGDRIILRSHFAKANPQVADSLGNKVLVIFTEPHAYISPKLYDKIENVPTWNYLAVHAYGKYNLLDGEENKAALLKETISYFESGYLEQWDSLPDIFKRNMMKGITAFEVVVEDLQAKAKLSQNKTPHERENIINELGHAGDTNEKYIADYMKRLIK